MVCFKPKILVLEKVIRSDLPQSSSAALQWKLFTSDGDLTSGRYVLLGLDTSGHAATAIIIVEQLADLVPCCNRD